MTIARFAQHAAGLHGIRRGCSLANSAGTCEFARERATWRPAGERPGLPGDMYARLREAA